MTGRATRSPVIIRSPNPAAQLRLFCLPYAGAGAAAYRDWHTLLPKDIEVAGVQLPGREWRIQEQPLTDMRLLAADVLAGIRPYLDKPFAFLGTSMGGTLVFELARMLRDAGEALPTCLMPMAIGAPHLPEEKLFHTLPDDELLAEIDGLDLSTPHVGHTFPFEKLPDAILLFQSGKTIGKVVIELP